MSDDEADLSAGESDSNIFFTTTIPALRPNVAEVQSSMQQPVVAPAVQASAGSTARQLAPRSWQVPHHLALETFICSSGPPEISRYNFNLVMRRIHPTLVRRQAYLSGGKHSLADTLVLTPAGEVRLKSEPHLQCFRLEQASSGKSAHGKEPPNCQRVCGGVGTCLPHCKLGSEKHHACTVRIVITASLEDVANSRRCVELTGA